MSQKQSVKDDRYKNQSIDSAALAGAATAAVLTIFMGEGPFMPMNALVGITLLLILFSYELIRPRRFTQNFAFGAVCAFCFLLIVGFVKEFDIGNRELDYWRKPQELKRSEVDPGYLAKWWLGSALVFSLIAIIVECIAKRKKQGATANDTTPTQK